MINLEKMVYLICAHAGAMPQRRTNMRILSIGNSFSQDAQRYLNAISVSDGNEIFTENLMFGGCSLAKHCQHIENDAKEYWEEINGKATGRRISIKDALLEGGWDIITLQQVSHESVNYDTYQPYLGELYAYVKELAPDAKIYIHQTWFYENGSEKLANLGIETSDVMLEKIKTAYALAYDAISADGMIRSGEMFALMKKRGIKKIHRDMFHASLGLSRYALGLLWYATLTGRSVINNTLATFDEAVSDDELKIARECAEEIARLL